MRTNRGLIPTVTLSVVKWRQVGARRSLLYRWNGDSELEFCDAQPRPRGRLAGVGAGRTAPTNELVRGSKLGLWKAPFFLSC